MQEVVQHLGLGFSPLCKLFQPDRSAQFRYFPDYDRLDLVIRIFFS